MHKGQRGKAVSKRLRGGPVNVEWFGSPNRWAGRNGYKPLAIVDHITAGLMPGCLQWMQNPSSKASAHYLITKDGRIIKLVKEEDTAWANGEVRLPDWPLYDNINPNLYTLSIEHESKGEALTEAQYQATLWLHRQLIDRWQIPIDSDHIIGHYRIDSVNRANCPGPNFPWDRLFKDLSGGVTVTEPWKERILQEAIGRRLINDEGHKAEEPVEKWFVAALAINLDKKMEKHYEMLADLRNVSGILAKYMIK